MLVLWGDLSPVDEKRVVHCRSPDVGFIWFGLAFNCRRGRVQLVHLIIRLNTSTWRGESWRDLPAATHVHNHWLLATSTKLCHLDDQVSDEEIIFSNFYRTFIHETSTFIQKLWTRIYGSCCTIRMKIYKSDIIQSLMNNILKNIKRSKQ